MKFKRLILFLVGLSPIVAAPDYEPVTQGETFSGFAAIFHEVPPAPSRSLAANQFLSLFDSEVSEIVRGVTVPSFDFTSSKNVKCMAYEITGYFRATTTGKHTFFFKNGDSSSLQIGAGDMCYNKVHASVSDTLDIDPTGKDPYKRAKVHLKKDKLYPIKIVHCIKGNDIDVSLMLIPPNSDVPLDVTDDILQYKYADDFTPVKSTSFRTSRKKVCEPPFEVRKGLEVRAFELNSTTKPKESQMYISGYQKSDFKYEIPFERLKSSLQIYGKPLTNQSFALELTGYFKPSESGFFNFTLKAHGVAALQIGPGVSIPIPVHFGQINQKWVKIDFRVSNRKRREVRVNLQENLYYPIRAVLINDNPRPRFILELEDPLGRALDLSAVSPLEFDNLVVDLPMELAAKTTPMWDENPEIPSVPQPVRVNESPTPESSQPTDELSDSPLDSPSDSPIDEPVDVPIKEQIGGPVDDPVKDLINSFPLMESGIVDPIELGLSSLFAEEGKAPTKDSGKSLSGFVSNFGSLDPPVQPPQDVAGDGALALSDSKSVPLADTTEETETESERTPSTSVAENSSSQENGSTPTQVEENKVEEKAVGAQEANGETKEVTNEGTKGDISAATNDESKESTSGEIADASLVNNDSASSANESASSVKNSVNESAPPVEESVQAVKNSAQAVTEDSSSSTNYDSASVTNDSAPLSKNDSAATQGTSNTNADNPEMGEKEAADSLLEAGSRSSYVANASMVAATSIYNFSLGETSTWGEISTLRETSSSMSFSSSTGISFIEAPLSKTEETTRNFTESRVFSKSSDSNLSKVSDAVSSQVPFLEKEHIFPPATLAIQQIKELRTSMTGALSRRISYNKSSESSKFPTSVSQSSLSCGRKVTDQPCPTLQKSDCTEGTSKNHHILTAGGEDKLGNVAVTGLLNVGSDEDEILARIQTVAQFDLSASDSMDDGFDSSTSFYTEYDASGEKEEEIFKELTLSNDPHHENTVSTLIEENDDESLLTASFFSNLSLSFQEDASVQRSAPSTPLTSVEASAEAVSSISQLENEESDASDSRTIVYHGCGPVNFVSVSFAFTATIMFFL